MRFFTLFSAGLALLLQVSGFGASTTQFGLFYNYGSGTAKQTLPAQVTVDTNSWSLNVPGNVNSGTSSTNTSGEYTMFVTNSLWTLTLTPDPSQAASVRLFLKTGAGLWSSSVVSSNETVGRINTSAGLLAAISDASGSGSLLFAGGALGAATATTQTAGDNSTKVATTAFVTTAVSGGTGLPATAQYAGAVLTPWVATNGTISGVWRKSAFVEEFVGNTSALGGNTANGGTATTLSAIVDTLEMGIGTLTTGTQTNGTALIEGNGLSLSGISFATNSLCVEWRIKTPSALSSDVDGYELYAGLVDASGNAAPQDGAFFYYIHSGASGQWQGKTSSNFSVSTASGGSGNVTVATSTWYNLRLEGTKDVVNFWVSSDDGVTWTFIGYCTSNIVTTSARASGLGAYLRKVGGSTGTTSVTAYVGKCVYWPPRMN